MMVISERESADHWLEKIMTAKNDRAAALSSYRDHADVIVGRLRLVELRSEAYLACPTYIFHPS